MNNLAKQVGKALVECINHGILEFKTRIEKMAEQYNVK